MTEHTPKPWWNELGVIHAKGPKWTPENHSCVHVATCHLSHADGDIIAAAPDLYEFVEGVARGPYPDSDLASLMETYRCRARALLDKIRD